MTVDEFWMARIFGECKICNAAEKEKLYIWNLGEKKCPRHWFSTENRDWCYQSPAVSDSSTFYNDQLSKYQHHQYWARPDLRVVDVKLDAVDTKQLEWS